VAIRSVAPAVWWTSTRESIAHSSRPDDAGLRSRLREPSSERRRFGYRRLHILLEREGWDMSWKKFCRIYREERLTVRKRGGRKRVLGTRAPMAIPQGPNQRWSLDFVSDSLAWGRRFRVLCIIDDFSRECPASVVDTSISGHRVARELDRIAELRAGPRCRERVGLPARALQGKTCSWRCS
jgi:putative transposase